MLDTDTSSYVIRNRSAAIAAKFSAIDPRSLCISTVTTAELLYGLKRIAPTHLLHVAVARFLAIVPVLDWTAAAAAEYAAIRHTLTSGGQPIGHMDMMIAAHALAAGAILVTNNGRHFGRIGAPLQIVNWV
jgi:tRNA(fMet)-specific endonuclease VapC